jgi:hypothetical protein
MTTCVDDDQFYPADLQQAQRLLDYWFYTECTRGSRTDALSARASYFNFTVSQGEASASRAGAPHRPERIWRSKTTA